MNRFKKTFISLFIIFNFLLMARIHLPLNTPFFKDLYQPINRYLSFFSIYQDWKMFSPDPMRLSVYLVAEVEFQDGTTAQYNFPRSQDLSLLEKYFYGEKYRKITTEGIRTDSHKFLWEDTAKFALRKLKDEHYRKIPVRVHLFRNWDEIPLMTKDFRFLEDRVSYYQRAKFYTYEVF